MFGVDPLPLALAGLLVGVVLGFLFQKGQVSKYAVIVGQFLLVDHTVIKVMLTAIVVGAVGVYSMLALGMIEGLLVKPALLAGVALGGLIFGVGMVGLGYCPGTGVAAAGEGSRHAWWGILGMLAGAFAYARFYPVIDDTFLTLWDYGNVTLPQILHVSPWVLVAGLVVLGAGAFTAITRWERGQPS